MPEISPDALQMSPWLVAIFVICAVAFLAVAVIWGIRAHRYKISAGREDMVGKIAVVRGILNPKGTVFIDGEQWTGISESGRVEPGEEVLVTRVDGLKLYVTRKQ